MSAPRGEFQQSNEESMFIAFAIIIPVLLFLGWLFFGKYVYAYERLAVYWVLSFGGLIPTDFPVWGWVTRQYLFFRYTKPGDIDYVDNALADSLIVNGVLFIPMSIYVMRKYLFIDENHPFVKYGRQMNLYDYMYDQFPLYPHLRTFWKLRLLGRPLDKGLFRKPDSAKDLSIFNGMVALPYPAGEPVIDEAKATELFRGQLGRLMPHPTGDPHLDARNLIAVLNNNEIAILAAIVPRLAACDEDASQETYEQGIATSQKLVNQFWESFDSWKPQMPQPDDDPDNPLNPPPPPVNTSGCVEVLEKYLPLPIVRASMLKHAYVRTFIYDAIQACRRVGKFPPCELRWVMMFDRVFWLMLSSAGRREPFWECAGIHAHYLYERKLKKPCEFPQVSEAVFALIDELDNRTAFSAREKQMIWEKQDSSQTAQAKQMAEAKVREAAKKAKESKK